MKIVIDTNIIFSLLLNSENTIGNIFFNSSDYFTFYSCTYMKFEISKHWDKLKKLSKLSEYQLEKSRELIYSKLHFIDEAIIPPKVWIKAEKIATNIDINDIDFIALSIFLKATLWTGDKHLYNGLEKIEFKKSIITADLFELIKLKRGKSFK